MSGNEGNINININNNIDIDNDGEGNRHWRFCDNQRRSSFGSDDAANEFLSPDEKKAYHAYQSGKKKKKLSNAKHYNERRGQHNAMEALRMVDGRMQDNNRHTSTLSMAMQESNRETLSMVMQENNRQTNTLSTLAAPIINSNKKRNRDYIHGNNEIEIEDTEDSNKAQNISHDDDSLDNRCDAVPAVKDDTKDNFKETFQCRETVMTLHYLNEQEKLNINATDAVAVKDFAFENKERMYKVVHLKTKMTNEEKEETRSILHHFVDDTFPEGHLNCLVKNQINVALELSYDERQTLYNNRKKFATSSFNKHLLTENENLKKDCEGLNKTVNNKNDNIKQLKHFREIDQNDHHTQVADLQKEHKTHVAELQKQHNASIERARSDSDSLIAAKNAAIETMKSMIELIAKKTTNNLSSGTSDEEGGKERIFD